MLPATWNLAQEQLFKRITHHPAEEVYTLPEAIRNWRGQKLPKIQPQMAAVFMCPERYISEKD